MNKPKILVVEDESVVARDLRHQLLELGYDPVAETRKAEEAVVLCGKLQPDLVLMDIQLAGETDGIAAAQTIRDRFAVPVVFLTAFASDQVVDRAKITEPFGYIIKPFDERELRTVIEMALYKHQAETRQREGREDYAALLRTALDGYWLLDLQGRILDVNDSGCRMHGYTREEILQLAMTDFESEESSAAIAAQLERIRRETSGRFERQQRRKDGHPILVEISANYRPSHGGQIIMFLRDITERRLLESQLRQSQKMEVVGQLAGGVAHDFNNILTAMMLNLELLRSTSWGPEVGSPLEDLEAMVKRAAKLTQQLLMFARQQAMQVAAVELNGALANLLRMLRRLLGEPVNLKFVTSASSLWVEVDAVMLDQAVMNLCLNARDAMPNGGTLTLATSRVEFDAETARAVAEARPGSFVCLQVSDTGCGMSAEIVRHMFEPFFTTKEVGKGTGLGLAAVHGIVHQHRGWITVESTVGQGTTFRLYLPSTAKPGHPGSATPFSELKHGGNETILLVEDEEIVRKVGVTMLEKLGYRVLAAADGQEALRLWEEQAGGINLLFTDMVLPGGLTGMELGARLQRLKPTLKIALMSGYSVEIMKSQSRALQGVAFLPKPFESRALAATIRQCLDGG